MALLCLLAVGYAVTVFGGEIQMSSPFEDLDVIPRVDLSRPRSEVIETVRKAANVGGPGFFYLMNHGIQESVFDNAIREAHRFFSQPYRQKNKITAIGYGGGSKPTKGYVPPAAEGRYEKDASDVRPETHAATGLANSREVLTFRFPEMDAVHNESYITNYNDFVHQLNVVEKVEHRFLTSGQKGSTANNARLYPSHPSNRVAETVEIAQAARIFFLDNQWPSET
jgi:isopenicillin N synthase-like dioxygenase